MNNYKNISTRFKLDIILNLMSLDFNYPKSSSIHQKVKCDYLRLTPSIYLLKDKQRSCGLIDISTRKPPTHYNSLAQGKTTATVYAALNIALITHAEKPPTEKQQQDKNIVQVAKKFSINSMDKNLQRQGEKIKDYTLPHYTIT